ncbi:Retrovirus-related Pol polyprotein, partial [Mucuna pruriens]
MVALSHNMMHKEIEVYEDDMIAKLKMPKQHIDNLRKLFIRLQKYKLRLNPTKCTFVIKTGKLLGFMVNEKGIEVDLDKVKAIRKMPTPKTESKDKLHSSFHLLVNHHVQFDIQAPPKNQKLEWNLDCQEAFDKIKQYLENPHVLIPIVPRKPLILYLTVLEESMARRHKKEGTDHLLSKQKVHKLRKEVPYTRTNLLCLGLGGKKTKAVHVASYHLANSQNKPHQVRHQRKCLSRTPSLSSYNKLLTLLYEFQDEHIMTTMGTKSTSDEWTMRFDGASNLLGNGIGAVLASPKDQCFPFSARLGFDCTKNMAEYKACAMGIMMALEHQLKKLKVFEDSTLVIYQLRGEWETRDVKLIPCHNNVKEMIEAFNAVTFHHVS